MSSFLKIFSIVCLLSSSALAEKITKIKIDGLNNVSRGTVLNYLGLEVGDDVNKISLNRSYKNLESSNLFSKIELNFNEGFLQIKTVENPTIKFFDIQGFKEDDVLSESIVADFIKNFRLNNGQIFNERNLNNLIDQITSFYKQNAFYKTKIKIDKEVDNQNRIGIEISINEGDRATIGKFNITGNTSFDSDELKDLFDMGEPDFFILNYFTENDYFDKRKFDAGIEKLINKYTSEGFLDINISNSEVIFNPELDKLELNISLVEGARYKLSQISFKGDKKNIEDKKLLTLLDVRNDSYFDRSNVIQGIKDIEQTYKDLGYAYVKISSDIVKREKNNLDLVITINPDNKIYISRINISGNNRTQDDVIRRKMKILEGSIYSKSEIDASISAIKRIGYFSDVKYEINRHKHSEDKADINIDVTETKTGEMSIGLSHSNSVGASINAGINQKNILGTGNTLEAKFSSSSAVEEYSFYFKDPYFTNDGESISYGFFNKTTDAANLDTSAYTIDESGFILGYGIPIGEYSNIFSELRLAQVNLSCGVNLGTLYETSDCANNDVLDAPLSITYSHNTLNDSFYPTNGNYGLLRGILASPLTDLKYLKLESNYKHYEPIFKKQTFKFSTRLNYGVGYGGDSLPFYKRYFEGGSSSIRGFDFNSLGAKYANGNPKGGELSLISSLGIATPTDIIGIDNQNMRLIGFIDAGAVSEKATSFDINDLRSSIGLQFSWLTPIGPIGLHVAKPIVKKSTDQTESLSFELGTTF